MTMNSENVQPRRGLLRPLVGDPPITGHWVAKCTDTELRRLVVTLLAAMNMVVGIVMAIIS